MQDTEAEAQEAAERKRRCSAASGHRKRLRKPADEKPDEMPAEQGEKPAADPCPGPTGRAYSSGRCVSRPYSTVVIHTLNVGVCTSLEHGFTSS